MSFLICWVDIESTGTDFLNDYPLELAYLVSTIDGDRITDTESFLLAGAEVSYVIRHCSVPARAIHEQSGLFADLYNGDRWNVSEVDHKVCRVLDGFSEHRILLGGSSPYLDRALLTYFFPLVSSRLSHMSIDTTTLSLTLESLGIASSEKHVPTHRAADDVDHSFARYCEHVDALGKLNRKIKNL